MTTVLQGLRVVLLTSLVCCCGPFSVATAADVGTAEPLELEPPAAAWGKLDQSCLKHSIGNSREARRAG